MKTFLSLVVILLIIAGCEHDEFPGSGEGLSMTIGNKVVLTAKDIDYYDLSTHFIYLKGTNSFLEEKIAKESFSIYANREKIYSGIILSSVSSYLPDGPVIFSPGIFDNDYLLKIGFVHIIDESGQTKPDLRKDPRIFEALKSQNQLHVGLQCEVRSVQISPGNQVKLELELINNDTFNYYYLDPDKMGLGLYHYFTNELFINDLPNQKSFTNHTKYIQPEPWNSWKLEWLSLIKSNEKKPIWIVYDNFDPVLPGQYKASFQFPGLSHVDKKDLIQQNGRIWLGGLYLSKDIQIR
jgi:hypothetical protein